MAAKSVATVLVTVNGMAQVVQRLQLLQRKSTRSKVSRSAVSKGLNPAAQTARQLVPRETGTLKLAIARRIRVYDTGNVAGVVGPKRKMGRSIVGTSVTKRGKKKILTVKGKVAGFKFRLPTKYAHLVEFGRKPVRPRKARVMHDGTTSYGTYARGVAPRPFMRPALDNNKSTMEQIVATELWNGLVKELGYVP